MQNGMMIEREIVERLLVSAAPERADELRELWSKYDPAFYVNPDCSRLICKAGKDHIDFTHQTLRHDWLLAFAAWKAFCAYIPVIGAAALTDRTLSPDLLHQDDGLSAAEELFEELVYSAREVRHADSVDDIPWPKGVPLPVADGSNLKSEDRLTFQLLCFATAAVFVHELRHVRFAQDGSRPAQAPDEERACDAAAREFLLSRAGEYAKSMGESLDKVLSKRAMGLALAAFIIHEATPAIGHAGSETHPPSADRFEELIGKATVAEDADCWAFASALLLAALRRARRFDFVVRFADYKDLCAKLIAGMREAYP